MRDSTKRLISRVLDEAGAWALQVQQRGEAACVELTTELHVHAAAIAIHAIKQRLGKGEVGLNPAGQATYVVVDRAVNVLA